MYQFLEIKLAFNCRVPSVISLDEFSARLVGGNFYCLAIYYNTLIKFVQKGLKFVLLISASPRIVLRLQSFLQSLEILLHLVCAGKYSLLVTITTFVSILQSVPFYTFLHLTPSDKFISHSAVTALASTSPNRSLYLQVKNPMTGS